MPSTARGLPYPAGSDAPDVPAAMEALAEELDDQLDAIDSDVAGKADSSAVSTALSGKQDADSDLSAIASATLSGDGFLKRASGVWSLDEPEGGGGGGSLPDQTGNGGAVLGTDGADAAWVRSIKSPDGLKEILADDDGVLAHLHDGADGEAGLDVQETYARIYATDDDTNDDKAEVRVTSAGDVALTFEGDFTVNGEKVVATGASDNDVLAYDSGTSTWGPASIGGGGGGGGLVLVDSGTFSAQSTINIDSVFDGTYDDYRIIISNTASGDVQLSLRLRASSTDATTDYGSFRTFAYSGGTGLQANNTGTDEWQVNNCGSSLRCSTVLDIIGPALAGEKTTFHGLSQGYFTSTGQIVTQAIGVHDVAAAYDGLSIRCDTNNITGRYAIYGYPK